MYSKIYLIAMLLALITITTALPLAVANSKPDLLPDNEEPKILVPGTSL